MKRLAFLVVAVGLLWASAAPAAEVPRYRLVMQVTEDSVDKLRLTLKHAANVQDTLGRDNVQIEVVAWGPGVNTLRYYTPLDEEIKQAVYRGVRVVVCEKSMRGAKLRVADMFQQVNLSYVTSGLAEIVVRETEGWSFSAP
jgi:intracellular sulfur oxidation DsrE/DsrF family protein